MSARSAPARADARVRTEMLRWMRLARRLEERIEKRIEQDRSGQPDGGARIERLGLGQEAVGVGVAMQAKPGDLLAPSRRDLGLLLVRGVAAGVIAARRFGRKCESSDGRDGESHLGDMPLGLLAAPSHLSDAVPVAAGAALAFKMGGGGHVAFCLFDERAAARGDWHEGINFAAVRRLPVVYVCATDENLMRPGSNREFAVETIADKAIAYGVPGVGIDGSDVLAVYQAAADAAARARGGEGPTLIEARVLRVGRGSHSGRDAADDAAAPSRSGEGSRPTHSEAPRGGTMGAAGRDPIDRLARELAGTGVVPDKDLEEMDRGIEREIDAALEWADRQPQPEPQDCLGGIYADSPPSLEPTERK